MSRRAAIALLLLAGTPLACASPPDGGPMSQARMETLIEAASSKFEGEAGAVQFTFGGVRMACVSDVAHNRMRIIAPIAQHDANTRHLLEVLLIANYHTTLDARYALSEDVLYAAYLHPLSSLSEAQLHSALRQVASLARSFGSAFTSGELDYGTPR